MRKALVGISVFTLMASTTLMGDPLKSTLMSTGKNDTPVVNLDNLDLAKKKKKSRPETAVVATIGGEDVIKKQVNKYLALRTQGHMTDFDDLPNNEQKLALINEMAIPLLAAQKAQKELSAEEKNAAMSRFWMQKSLASTEVTDEEAKNAYDKLTKAAKEAAKKQSKEAPKLPKFEEAKREIMLQLAQEKIVKALLSDGKIKLK